MWTFYEQFVRYSADVKGGRVIHDHQAIASELALFGDRWHKASNWLYAYNNTLNWLGQQPEAYGMGRYIYHCENFPALNEYSTLRNVLLLISQNQLNGSPQCQHPEQSTSSVIRWLKSDHIGGGASISLALQYFSLELIRGVITSGTCELRNPAVSREIQEQVNAQVAGQTPEEFVQYSDWDVALLHERYSTTCPQCGETMRFEETVDT